MDDLIQYLSWLVPLLVAVGSWLALKLRESEWGQELLARIGLMRREHEQEWEYQRRLGSLWLSVAGIIGILIYPLGRRLLESQFDVESWELAVVLLGVIAFVWSFSKSLKALRASRRPS